MPHDTSLITTIVAGLVLAFVFGAIANRLRLPPLVGYLIAGVVVGPHSPGFVADQGLANQLADIGVILLMFGVGLHFSLKDLLSVRAVAIPGALVRIVGATALGIVLAGLMGWSLLAGLVFGMALAVSSTVVVLNALQERHLIDSDRGRIAVGWLIVEDVAMVLALVLIPAFAPPSAAAGPVQADPFVALAEQMLHTRLDLVGVLVVTVIKLLAFTGFMVVVGRRIIPFILHATAHTGSRELFRLAVLAIALGVAAGAAYLFGVSIALGAFFAGMILSESELSQRAAQETLPLRDAFGVLFFVSVGMLFDPSILVREPLPVVASLLIILFGKSIIGFLLLVLFRRPVAAALTISAGLAQIGEFSFILAALGVALGIMPAEGRDLILAGSIISIILNPGMFWLAERLRPRLEARATRHAEPELGPVVPDHADEVEAPVDADGEVLEEMAHPTQLNNHMVLIGYGRVGSVVGGELLRENVPFVLIEDAEDRIHAAREAGIEVIVGNAATRNSLMLANVMGARCVVIGIPNAFEAGQATEQCRKLNAAIKIIARAHSDEEVEYLHRLGADEVVMGEREIGLGMIDWLHGVTRGTSAAEARSPRLVGGDNLLAAARERQPAGPGRVPDPVPLPAGPLRDVSGGGEEEPAMTRPATLAPTAPESAPPAIPPAVGSDDEPAAAPKSPVILQFVRPTATTPPPAPSTPELPEPPAPLATPAAPHGGPEDLDVAPATPTDAEPGAATTDGAAPADPQPAASTAGPPPAPESPIAAPPPADRTADDGAEGEVMTAEIPVTVRSGNGFRTVPASEITILPPEPVVPPAAAAPKPPTAPAFRSEFWQEDEPPPPPTDEPELFVDPDRPLPPLRDVHEAEASRSVIAEAAWLEALERDLFGAGPAEPAPARPEVPPPTPQPFQPPQPSETPEPKQPVEAPPPTPQPIETPEPVEVPVTPPSPNAPPRADAADDDRGKVDPPSPDERREPHLY